MKTLVWFCVSAIALCSAVAHCAEPTGVATDDQYRLLLRATRYVENYKESAAVSARRAATRNEGSDAEYAKVMGQISTANLDGAVPCLIRVYQTSGLTRQDTGDLTRFFTSASGTKLLAESQRMQILSLQAGAAQPVEASRFTDQEKRDVAAFYQSSAAQKYGAFVASPATAEMMMKCILDAAGIENPNGK